MKTAGVCGLFGYFLNVWGGSSCSGKTAESLLSVSERKLEPGRRRKHSWAWAPAPQKLETHHHWFWLQANTPDFFDSLLYLFLEGKDIGGGGAAAIDDGESVLGRNADVAESESFGES